MLRRASEDGIPQAHGTWAHGEDRCALGAIATMLERDGLV